MVNEVLTPGMSPQLVALVGIYNSTVADKVTVTTAMSKREDVLISNFLVAFVWVSQFGLLIVTPSLFL
jgi:hypothetical protein